MSKIKSESIVKPKAILFDWDNTLADTWPTIHEALTKTFEQMGHTPWTFAQTKERVHRSLRDSFPEIFGQQWEQAGKLYITHFESIHLDRLQALEGAEDVLRALLGTDIYVAVVSNKTGYNLRREITHLGWDKYFQKAVGAKDAAQDKPSPDPVHMALEGSRILPSEQVWLVGDSVTDLECAHNSKCIPVFYGHEDLMEERFKHCQPSLHVQDHKVLKRIVDHFV